MYIHFRILTNWPRLRVFCPILQLAAICLAAYVSISRLQDYKHHTGDVIGGGIIGIVFTLSAVSSKNLFISCFLKHISFSLLYHDRNNMLFLLALLMLPAVCCSFRSLYRSIKTQRLGGVFWEEVMIRPTLVTQWTLSSVQSCIKPTVNPERLRMARHNSTGSSNDKI